MSKLLNKPFKIFTIYALITLLCSIPIYYFVVDRIWLNELDEHNKIIKQLIEKRFDKIQIGEKELKSTLQIWNILQPGTTITPIDLINVNKDSVYVITRKMDNAVGRFRGLSSYFNANGQAYHLIVETNVEETNETIVAISLVTICFFFLLVFGFILLNKRIASKIWQPFSSTLDKLKSFDLTKDKNIKFDKTDIQEFNDLNHTLNKLIKKNISVYNQQKIFIENASHELQTPLAVLKSKMDMLFQNKDITHEQLAILDTIALPLSRISRINKNLLLLAKIENSQFIEVEQLDLSVVLDDNIILLIDYIHNKHLIFNKNINHPFFISCNKFLLEILLNNLLTNAIRHTPKGGFIVIEFIHKTLLFKNSGTENLHHSNLFKRFLIASKEATSSGLGLAIAKEICDRYNWRIIYSFENNFHCFSVTF